MAARHMTRAAAALLAAAVLGTALAGCLGPRTLLETRQYLLAPPVGELPAGAGSGNTLGVRPLIAAMPYDLRMAVLTEEGALGYLSHDKWAERPEDSVTRALTDALRATGRFSDAGDAAEMVRPSLILTGELRALRLNRAVSPAVAEVEVRMELRAAREPKAVWTGTLVETEPVPGDNGAGFAEAAKHAAGRLVTRAAAEMAKATPDAPVPPAE